MILVTGASGFLGQHLVRYLSAQGYAVRALYHRNAPGNDLLNLPSVSWMQCDLLDIFAVEEAMQGITDVYHCAALVSFNPRRKDEMLHFNTLSTAHVVDEALEHGIRKLIFVSSVAALGRTEKNNEITEEEDWEESDYNSAYGMSKHLAELEVWRAIGEGLNGVIINPGIILGEGDWNDGSARLMTVVNNQFPFYTTGITAWVDVQDVIKVMHMLMQSDITDERFILSAGNFGFRDIFTKMAHVLNKKPPSIKAGSFMTGLVWRFIMLKSRLFHTPATITKETARNAQKKCYYNNDKLFKFLPDFSYTPVDQTINRMAKAFLTNNQ